MMKVVIIGGGPAGLIAAISAAQENNEVIVLEKMNEVGRKLLITGKGRCNITSNIPMEEFIRNIPGNGKFLYGAFNNFTNEDIISLLKEQGVNVKVERGQRIFPVTDRSIDVRDAIVKKVKKLDVKIIVNAKVQKIMTKKNNNENTINVSKVEYLINGKKEVLDCEKVILATGGKSYPKTGSTGDGYEIAKKLGHTVTKIVPSLVPLEAKGDSIRICKQLQGLSLKNVGVKFVNIERNKEIYKDFGEMIFTHFGLSGPTILSGSAHLLRYKNLEELLQNNKIKILIDLKPALSNEKLDERILRDFLSEKNKLFKNSLDALLPKKMIDTVIEISNINPNKQVNEITKKERENLVNILKKFEITIKGFRPIEEAIVTAGGINIKEINPKTMESKLVKGLYFAGEIIDVDAYTGGFNLQIAYSTGYTAGKIM
jgi:predicted Rossmann fold flavoprotein